MLQDFFDLFSNTVVHFSKKDITQNTYWKKHTVLKQKKMA